MRFQQKKRIMPIKRINRILDAFEDTLKTAENVYGDAMKKGDVKIRKKIQKQIEKIKREESSLHNITSIYK